MEPADSSSLQVFLHMSTRDQRLAQFFGGYFHQDWDVEGASSWCDVIEHYVSSVPRDHVIAIRDDLWDWLSESTTGQNLPAEFGCDYNPRVDGLTEREWVSHLVAEMDRRLDT